MLDVKFMAYSRFRWLFDEPSIGIEAELVSILFLEYARTLHTLHVSDKPGYRP